VKSSKRAKALMLMRGRSIKLDFSGSQILMIYQSLISQLLPCVKRENVKKDCWHRKNEGKNSETSTS